MSASVALPSFRAEKIALYAGAVVIIALTSAAFWLSYAHLAAVAGEHGLATSEARRWAWPATLDLFIVAGEILMFRAAVRKVTDWWAIGLTVVGSLGSIALNVAGVGTGAAVLDYVVAAVPPSAALLAFGALMRQVHVLVVKEERVAVVAPEPVAIDVAKVDTPPAMPVAAPVMPPATLDDVVKEETDTATDQDDVNGQPDNVVDMDKPLKRSSTSRGRTLADIQAAVDYLTGTGQDVNGTTYGEYVGVSSRTGRRDLERLGILAA
ncbi:DUF2637 domain-containing protein [Streptomyces kronopolitis]|uniref:DUF2637 domain-containing protein n=1 Tax=Streptomyces kronopolitis TaxID=1612435 RepID=UPI00341BBE65